MGFRRPGVSLRHPPHDPDDPALARREFIGRSAGALLAAALALGRPSPAWAGVLTRARASGPHTHPTPRPGIDASKVLTKGQLKENPDAAPVFDMVRQIPQVVDGVRCNCGCAELPEFYSLLSCFETDGMAQHCMICQGQARLAFRMHGEGKTLDQIRTAIDAKFG
ncbi:MAG TPA: PCYCGC motif-containing (lipo)protein [Gemmatimonadaceae bacterium]|nr:PCYCGC motif-containing (lipo)protein [Gemmatimonadaceae bacterium]